MRSYSAITWGIFLISLFIHTGCQKASQLGHSNSSVRTSFLSTLSIDKPAVPNDKNTQILKVTDYSDPTSPNVFLLWISEGKGFVIPNQCSDTPALLGISPQQPITDATTDTPSVIASKYLQQPQLNCKFEEGNLKLFFTRKQGYQVYLKFKTHPDYLFQAGCMGVLKALGADIRQAKEIIDPEDMVTDPSHLLNINCYSGLTVAPKPTTFREWCEASKKDELTDAEALTMSILFSKVGSVNCKKAEEKLSVLEKLDLSDSSITDLGPVSSLKQLKELNLSKNPLESLAPLKELTLLLSLNLSQTGISDITAIKSMETLQELNLAENNIKNITPIQGLKYLKSLTLRKNQIKDISPLNFLSYLESLDLSENLVESVAPLLPLQRLNVLKVDKNPILNQVEKLEFKDWCILRKSLSNEIGVTVNAILKKLGTQNCLDAVQLARDEKNLDLSNSQISDITPLKALTNLNFLDLSKNRIENISPLESLPNLMAVNLSFNQLKDLQELQKLAKVSQLQVLGNPFQNKLNALLAVGPRFGCQVTLDGQLQCWDSAPKSVRFRSLSPTFDSIICGITDNDSRVHCWGWDQGDNRDVILRLPPELRAKKVDQFEGIGCAIQLNSKLVCWGNEAKGIFQKIPTDIVAFDVAVGRNQVCAILMDNETHCWSKSEEINRGAALALYSGGKEICLTRRSDQGPQIYSYGCWSAEDGFNYGGGGSGLGMTHTMRLGLGRSCSIVDNELSCRAINGAPLDFEIPDEIKNKPIVKDFHMSTSYFCAELKDSRILCWQKKDSQVPLPTPPKDQGPLRLVKALEHGACALKTDGTLVCWSSDSMTAELIQKTLGSQKFSQISIGYSHACGILKDSSVRCAGGPRDVNLTPPQGLKATSIASDSSFSCATLVDGTPQCWGRVDFGGYHEVPANLEKGASIFAGGEHACVISPENLLDCWGLDFGYLPFNKGPALQGDATLDYNCIVKPNYEISCYGNPYTRFDKIPKDLRGVSVSVGHHNICTLSETGLPQCYGSGAYPRFAPQNPKWIYGTAVSIATSDLGHCAMLPNGQTRCWINDGMEVTPPGLRWR